MHFVTSRVKNAEDNSMPDIKQYFCFNKLILAENVAHLGVMCSVSISQKWTKE